jgi:hypothetical protein
VALVGRAALVAARVVHNNSASGDPALVVPARAAPASVVGDSVSLGLAPVPSAHRSDPFAVVRKAKGAVLKLAMANVVAPVVLHVVPKLAMANAVAQVVLHVVPKLAMANAVVPVARRVVPKLAMANAVAPVVRRVDPKLVMANVAAPVARRVVLKLAMANAVARVARRVVLKPVMANAAVLVVLRVVPKGAGETIVTKGNAVVRRDANVASAKQGNAKVASVAREAKVAVGPRRATMTATTATSRSRL